MSKHEKAIITVTEAAAAAETQIGLGSVTADKVVLTVFMKHFDSQLELWRLHPSEKIDFALARKDRGAVLFKEGRFAMALHLYKKVEDLLNNIEHCDSSEEAKREDIKRLCRSNQAACHLKMSRYKEAKSMCDAILSATSQDVKTLYRRAQAQLGFNELSGCISDCKRVVQLDPQNKEARNLLKQALARQREEDKKSKGMFANMCKALGQGPIPEPGQPAEEEIPDDDMHSFFEGKF
eukprot:TRINITY_DN98103_c0_g1_i1.p1 TRINITY_DN98103_c0_g1~~TRINITY_DN98103_c0_g1_i1.p1  ORF type:complete len:237 (-),score=59.06 TRINITY_DN98103_c0_g1_i1:43-753(-)